MASRRTPPRDPRSLRVEHQVPPGHEVVLPRGLLFRAFRHELLEHFTRPRPAANGKADP